MALKLRVTTLTLLITLIATVSTTVRRSGHGQSDQQDDYHWLEMTNKILRWVVFPLVVFGATSCNYFIMFTVFDLGFDRACKVLMGCVALTDFIQLITLILVKSATGTNFSCKFISLLVFIATHLTQNQTAIFNVDRVLAVSRFQWYTDNIMHNTGMCGILFLFNVVLSTLLNIPFFFLHSYDQSLERCLIQGATTVSRVLLPVLGVWAVFYVAVPFLVIIPANIYVAYKLRNGQQVRDGVTNFQNQEDEVMFTKGAVSCGISFTFFSLLSAMCVSTIAFIYSGVLLNDVSDYVKYLYVDLISEVTRISISLNMCVAFATFTMQSRTFRRALIADEYQSYFFPHDL
ncbi:uncharacterized protein LOC142335430 [Convolutriloba macropyga]|uniref:uncharacterized protein LOC142335430 n=1 Tax=Convolutriloba macropyga TaxID=536237 RepID=UPI003F526B55